MIRKKITINEQEQKNPVKKEKLCPLDIEGLNISSIS